jgi:hypothetical protein
MITPHLFITVHTIEGYCVKGGAEDIFGSRLVCTKFHVFLSKKDRAVVGESSTTYFKKQSTLGLL